MKIMRNALLILLIIILVYSAIALSLQNPLLIARRLVKKDRLSSREINFQLNYLVVIPVADTSIEKLGQERFRQQDLIHIRAVAKTFDYVKSIFYARATVDSYLNPQNLNAVYFFHHLEMINKPAEKKEIWYDQKRHIMVCTDKAGTKELVIDRNTYEPLSAFFFIQNLRLMQGEEFSLSLNTNQKNYLLNGKCISKNPVRIDDKNYDILLVKAQVKRKDKSPRHGFTLKIWFLDDGKSKTPLLVKASTNIGPIVAIAQ